MLLKVEEILPTSRGAGALATAADPGKDLIVAAVTQHSVAQASTAIEEAGMKVSAGEWSLGGEGLEINELGCELHIGAVAYHSKDAKPGLFGSTPSLSPALPPACFRRPLAVSIQRGAWGIRAPAPGACSRGRRTLERGD